MQFSDSGKSGCYKYNIDEPILRLSKLISVQKLMSLEPNSAASATTLNKFAFFNRK